MVRKVEAHEPKPIHSWGDFLKEVGTIVLGVLIALAAGEIADAWNWKQQVAIVEDSLDDELADSLYAAQERIKIADCQRRTLDALDQLADTAGGTMVIRNSPVSRNRIWASSAWEAAVASGAIAHMPHDTRNTYSVLFSYVDLFRDLNLRQQQLWASIDAYRHQRHFTETSRDRFIETIAQLRSLTGTMNMAARQFVDAARPLHIQMNPQDAAELQKPLICPMP